MTPYAGQPISPRELQALVLYVETGHHAGVADAMGIHVQTSKSHLRHIYRKLDADGLLDALQRLGWLRIPEHMRTPASAAIGSALPAVESRGIDSRGAMTGRPHSERRAA